MPWETPKRRRSWERWLLGDVVVVDVFVLQELTQGGFLRIWLEEHHPNSIMKVFVKPSIINIFVLMSSTKIHLD